MFSLLTTAVELGLLYGVAVYGVFLSFRVLNFPDLSADGSFVTGAGATALIIRAGGNPVLALLVGFGAAFLSGLLTAFLHIRLGISKILAGIVSLSMLYTLNLRIMGGPNLSLLSQENLLPWFKEPVNHFATIAFLLVLMLVIKFAIDAFLRSEFGLYVQGTGYNEGVVRSLGFNPNFAKAVTIGLSNGIVGLAGGLTAQNQGFVDINMGIGTLVFCLASFMLGDALFGGRNTIPVLTTAVIVGSVLYQMVIAMSLRLGLPATDLKFITAVIVVGALVVGKQRYAKSFFSN